MTKLHYFNFSWGHVESSRIAMLPSWYHAVGFDTVEAAAESFARCLMTQVPPTKMCPIHGKHNSHFCPDCGTATTVGQLSEDWQFAYEFFNNLYVTTANDSPSSDTNDWDRNWYAEWEVIETAGMKPIVVECFDRYLETGDPEELICDE